MFAVKKKRPPGPIVDDFVHQNWRREAHYRFPEMIQVAYVEAVIGLVGVVAV
jgi:hypothetical protein